MRYLFLGEWATNEAMTYFPPAVKNYWKLGRRRIELEVTLWFFNLCGSQKGFSCFYEIVQLVHRESIVYRMYGVCGNENKLGERRRSNVREKMLLKNRSNRKFPFPCCWSLGAENLQKKWHRHFLAMAHVLICDQIGLCCVLLLCDVCRCSVLCVVALCCVSLLCSATVKRQHTVCVLPNLHIGTSSNTKTIPSFFLIYWTTIMLQAVAWLVQYCRVTSSF